MEQTNINFTNIELERFLRENPEYKLLADCSDKEIIEWASKNRFITLTFACTGDAVYTEHDLTVAKMWKQKLGDDDDTEQLD